MSTSSTDRVRLLLALAAALLLAACASAPKKPARPAGDSASVVRPVRQQPAAPAVQASDSTHVTTVTATTETQTAAQQAINDYYAGLQKMKDGKLDDAQVLFQQIATEHATLSGPLVNEALILYKQGKHDEAMESVEQAIKVNDRNPFAWNLRGILMRERGKFADARTSYETALTIDPLYAKAHFNLGVLADLYLQDQRLALSHYERYQSLQRKPDVAVGNWINDLRNRLGIVEPKPAPAPAPTADPAAPPASPAGTAAPAEATPTPANGRAG